MVNDALSSYEFDSNSLNLLKELFSKKKGTENVRKTKEMETKRVKLEPFYLSTVVTYISSTITFENFRKVSKNCEEAVKMLHTNPQ